ncbi:unnamed protein product [Symbiodinium microadriaticum]|nr:unnamed protein product [Symbiodinium microadriaticum]
MSILKAAKKEMELTIATDSLSLFTDSTCSQPTNDTTPVDDIRGGTHEAPLLIHYDEADAPPDVAPALRQIAAAQQAIREKQDAICEKQDAIANDSQMAARVMLTPRLRTTHARDPSFRLKVYQHQAAYVTTNQCIVLSQKFPETAKSMWFGPTVADHILPHGEVALFYELKMDRDDPRNGLPLLDHIEKLYGRGLISFMPVSSQGPRMQLQMLVAQRIQHEYLQCGVHNKCPSWVQVNHSEAISLQEYPHGVRLSTLHAFCFYVNTIFLRSLFLRATAVHKISLDLPDPSATPEKFEECPSLKAKLSRFFASQEEGAESIDPPSRERDSPNVG